MQEHMKRVDMEVAQIVEHSREGQILLSIPPICPMYAAAILATSGHIANFEDAGHLKSYFGWAPKRAQTGVSFDRTSLTRGGTRPMKKVMYLVAWNAIKSETEWASLYKRLVPRLCTYDERTQTYTRTP
jgi:transposase